MASEWQLTSLGDLIDVKHGFAFQGNFIHEEPRGDILLTPGNFAIGGGFKGDKYKYYDGSVPNEFVLQEGDLIVTMTDLSKEADTLGFPAFVPARSDSRRYLHNQRLGKVLVKDKRAIETRFLHYLLCSASYRHEILASATGTTVKHTSPERIRRFRFPRPSLPEQRAIAHILGTLDDKIELNRQMNETLEAIARAIFKSWFVDFLPVRAKMAAKENDPSLLLPKADLNTWFVYAIECNDGSHYIGQTEDLRQRWLQHIGGRGGSWTKQHPPVRVSYWERQPSREAAVERENWLKTGYGRKWLKKDIAARTQTGDPVRAKVKGRAPNLPKHISDLFPDRFEESELGEIPLGWEAVPLPKSIEVNPARPLRKGEVAPYLDMANMPTRGHTPDAVIDRPFGSGMRFENGDTLVARITPCLENGKTAYVDYLKEGQVGWGSTEYIVLRPRPPLPDEFAYCLARSDGFREFAIQSMTGSSGRQRVPAESLSHFMLAAPSQQIAKCFGTFVRPLFARASAVARESRTLAVVRDTLLPNLISGELRVKDRERFERAT